MAGLLDDLTPEEIADLQEFVRKRSRMSQGVNTLKETAADVDRKARVYGGLPSAELRQWDPVADAGLRDTPSSMEFARDFAMQPVRAGEAVGKAAFDPSIPNMTNAGFETAMTIGRPMGALKILGAGYGAAVADDTGLLDSLAPGEAQAAPKNKLAASFANGFTPEELEPISQKTGIPVQTLGAMRRTKINEIVQSLATTAGAAATQTQSEAERLKREEYDRQVKSAEAARQTELGRDRRFQDTTVGKVFDATGGLAAPAAGFAFGSLSRAATGPGKTAVDRALKDYALPIGVGGLVGVAAYNAPAGYEALYAPTLNPQREAMLAYIREAPRGDPKRQEYESFLRDTDSYPIANPVKSEAMRSLKEEWPYRVGMGALEGSAGMAGSDLVRAIGRPIGTIGRLFSRGRGGGPGPQGPLGGGPQPGPQPVPQRPVGGLQGGPGGTPTPLGAGPGGPGRPQGTRGPASKPLSRAEKDALTDLYQKNPQLSPADSISAIPSLTGKEARILAHLGEVDKAAKATGKRNRDAAFAVVKSIRNSNLALPLAAGAGAAAGAASDPAEASLGILSDIPESVPPALKKIIIRRALAEAGVIPPMMQD